MERGRRKEYEANERRGRSYRLTRVKIARGRKDPGGDLFVSSSRVRGKTKGGECVGEKSFLEDTSLDELEVFSS